MSYHPNLLTNWFEGRFFDSLPTPADVETEWRQYLRSLPRIPGGKGSVSKYWTFDKSPGYATNIQAAQAAARLIPNARLLFLTRNPTQRAYSFFLMLTNHYVRGQKVSYFAKSDVTGGVVYVRPPGKGGALVPDGVIGSKSKSNNNKTDIKWRYLSYPPDPSDFHNWVEHAIAKAKTNLRLDHQGRPNRILQGGIYAEYLKKWLTYFPMEQFIIVPTESFHKDTLNSMNQLQAMMRLPTFDYSSIAKKDEKSGRVDIPASLGTTLNSFINSYKPQKPMLDTTRYLLNEFYCESNRKLTQMLGGRALPGYSCGEEGV